MPTERGKVHLLLLLKQAEAAALAQEWDTVRAHLEEATRLAPDDPHVRALAKRAERATRPAPTSCDDD